MFVCMCACIYISLNVCENASLLRTGKRMQRCDRCRLLGEMHTVLYTCNNNNNGGAKSHAPTLPHDVSLNTGKLATKCQK